MSGAAMLRGPVEAIEAARARHTGILTAAAPAAVERLDLIQRGQRPTTPAKHCRTVTRGEPLSACLQKRMSKGFPRLAQMEIAYNEADEVCVVAIVASPS